MTDDLRVNFINSSGNGYVTIGNQVDIYDGDFSGKLTIRKDTNQIRLGVTTSSTQSYPNPGSDITLTYPNQTCNIVGDDTSNILSNKTINAAGYTGTQTGTFTTNGTMAINNVSGAALTVTGTITGGVMKGGNFLSTYIGAVLHNNNVQQGLTTNSRALMVLNTTEYNINTTTNLTAGNMYIEITSPGFYLFVAQAYFTATTGLSYQNLMIQRTNGTPAVLTDEILSQSISRTATDSALNTQRLRFCATGDRIYASVQANATTGPRLSTTGQVPTRCYLMMQFIGQ